MPIKAEYQTETYLKKLADVTSQSVVECRFSPGDGVSELLAVCPQVCPAVCEAASGRINYGGRLVCTAVYAGVDGRLGRAQKGAEFTHFAEGENFAPAQTAFCRLGCERVTVRREGSSFVVSAVISAHISVYGSAERCLLTSADGAVCDMRPAKLLTAVTFSGESEVEDDFEAAGVEDILMHDARCVVTDCRCCAGEIRINGEICLSLLAVRGQEPVTLDRTIPFSAEILCDDAVASCRAQCCCQLAEAAVSAQVNEERGRCAVNFSARLKFFGEFCAAHEVVCAADAFRTDGTAEVEMCTEAPLTCDDIKVWSERVGGVCSVSAKLDYGCALKAVVLPSAECTWSADTGVLEGAVNATLIYSRGGEMHGAEITLPFSAALSGSENAIVTGVAVSGVSVRQRAEGECEAEAVLRITAAVCTHKECSYVCRIGDGRDDEAEPCAISVLVPEPGETLWSAAKRLKLPPERVQEACAGATFPLSGSERILIYRRKQ